MFFKYTYFPYSNRDTFLSGGLMLQKKRKMFMTSNNSFFLFAFFQTKVYIDKYQIITYNFPLMSLTCIFNSLIQKIEKLVKTGVQQGILFFIKAVNYTAL